jgi:hypothetical protein
MSEDASARLALPLLAAGQAQKEMTVNEALARLDIAVQTSVVAGGVDQPPTSPIPGQGWIIGANPTGDWSGRAGAVAGWTDDGWRFVAPMEGMTAWVGADGVAWRYTNGGWAAGDLTGDRVVVAGVQVVGAQAGAIAPPDGGAVIDAEARGAVSAILAALRAHGLIAP